MLTFRLSSTDEIHLLDHYGEVPVEACASFDAWFDWIDHILMARERDEILLSGGFND